MRFPQLWHHFYGESHPLGHELRVSQRQNWVRFHSLPDSQRYAKTDREMDTILTRQNAIAEQTMSSDGRGWLVCCVSDEAEHQDRPHPYRNLIAEFHMQKYWNFLGEPDGEVTLWVHAAPIQWQPHFFDAVLTEIANDEVRALWIAATSGSIFAPYDGGIDCIVPTPVAMNALRDRFRTWLSSHPDGL